MLEQKQERGRVYPWSWKQETHSKCRKEEKLKVIPVNAGMVEVCPEASKNRERGLSGS